MGLGGLGSLQVVLCLDVVQLLLLLVHVHALEGLVGLVVEHYQVAVAHVEPRQVVAGVFGVENVLVDNKGGAAGLRSVASAKCRANKIEEIILLRETLPTHTRI